MRLLYDSIWLKYDKSKLWNKNINKIVIKNQTVFNDHLSWFNRYFYIQDILRSVIARIWKHDSYFIKIEITIKFKTAQKLVLWLGFEIYVRKN